MSRRLVRFLLRLLPSDFRGDFGRAMMADLDARAGSSWSEIPGLAAAIVREHASVFKQDLKHAVRVMRRTPGFTAAAILMLAIGIGVNTSLFTVIDAVLIRSPFPHTDRLVIVGSSGARGNFSAALALDRYQALVRETGPLESVGVLGRADPVLNGDEPRRLRVDCVTASMFDVLETPPLIGRAFRDAESKPGAAPVVVLSYNFWQQLGGSPTVLGTALRLNDAPATVIGVMPNGFGGVHSSSRLDAWAPLDSNVGDSAIGCETSPIVNAFGRLKPGVTVATAERAIGDLRLLPLSDEKQQLVTPFRVLSAAVMCVLLIACANVGSLQLERTLARRREFALRAALGASRGRLVRQSLTESLVLALMGGAAGLTLAALTLPWIVSLLPTNISHVSEIALNGRAILATVGCAIVAAVLSGVFPVMLTAGFQPGKDMTGYARATERGGWPRRALAAAELALSLLLLIGAALMIQTFRTLAPSSPGFDYAHKLTTTVRLPPSRTASPQVAFDGLFERVNKIDGVRAVTGSTYVPMTGTTTGVSVMLDGSDISAHSARIRPDYFSVMKIGVVEGRPFNAGDTASAPLVTIVNQTMARALRPGGSVLGATLRLTPGRGPAVERMIVGVIADTRSMGSDIRAWSEVYVPFAQDPWPTLNLFVETDGRASATVPAELRSAIRAIAPDMVLEPVVPYAPMVERTVAYPRLGAWLLGVFALVAIGLAAAGLVTTVGWWISQRTREIAVRVALGATRAQVRSLVFRESMTIVMAGLAAGVGTAVIATRYMKSWIYGVTPLDVPTFAASAGILFAVALVAIFFPTRRATRVDPVVALRAE
jgi:predicted permease